MCILQHTLVGSWLTPDIECVISGDDEQSVVVCFTGEENTQIYAANLTNDAFLPIQIEVWLEWINEWIY